MADTDNATAPAPVKAPKKKIASKPKATASHPQYKVMVNAAIAALKERGGSSRQAILKYIVANYKLGDNPTAINARLKSALKAGVKAGSLKQSKGTGAAGSFRLGEKTTEEKPKKPAVKKVAEKKAKSPKKAAAKPKKPTAEKKALTKSPKKTATKKPAAPKKVKSPKKVSAAKPKKAKSPKKPVAAKPKVAKKPAVKKAKTPKKAATAKA